MVRLCEKLVNSFLLLFFGKTDPEKMEVEQSVEYTLSSVFPTKKIMCEVKKYI